MTNKRLLDALKAIIDQPYGCRFCDSGKLRDASKSHDDNCAFMLARAAIEPSAPQPTAEPSHEEKCRNGTLYSDAELVQRAIANCKGRKAGIPLWSSVRHVFCCGSTLAAGLCRRFGYDPDEVAK